jgi:6-phosphogluconolactonase/glucosamine-6-phosphate isomerase/deaminase
MNIERIVAGTERGFAEKSCDYIEGCIRAFQKMSSAGSFVMGLSGPNGRVRRARALDTFTELAKRESIDWDRVKIFLVDERYGQLPTEEDSNAYLVRKAFGTKLKDANLLVPDVSLPTAEACAADYLARLDALFSCHAPDGPHLTTLSLAPDGSVASVFPEWYSAEPARWAEATAKRFGVLCPATASFEVPQRIAVNLRVVRKSKHVRARSRALRPAFGPCPPHEH